MFDGALNEVAEIGGDITAPKQLNDGSEDGNTCLVSGIGGLKVQP